MRRAFFASAVVMWPLASIYLTVRFGERLWFGAAFCLSPSLPISLVATFRIVAVTVAFRFVGSPVLAVCIAMTRKTNASG